VLIGEQGVQIDQWKQVKKAATDEKICLGGSTTH